MNFPRFKKHKSLKDDIFPDYPKESRHGLMGTIPLVIGQRAEIHLDFIVKTKTELVRVRLQ